jgi:hypothetical protein
VDGDIICTPLWFVAKRVDVEMGLWNLSPSSEVYMKTTISLE